jgi:CheY-like chemotaxis protein
MESEDVIPDHEKLRLWYLTAMLRRADELRGLRESLQEQRPGACDAARKIGQALRGSGATFGFPVVTDVATLLETAADADVRRRVEGVIHELRRLTAGSVAGDAIAPEWLPLAGGLDDPAAAAALSGDLGEAWHQIGQMLHLDPRAMAARVADYLGLDVADLADRNRTALRLVPEALVSTARVVPLREDSETITIATAHPTDLIAELELQRLTGRRPVFVVAPPGAIDSLVAELYGEAGAGRTRRLARVVDPELQHSVGRPEQTASETRPKVVVPDDAGEEIVMPDGAGRDVLVVDDDPSARLLVKALLEKRGFDVLQAGNGLEALQLLDREKGVALVVADLNMPRMDGLELMWEIRDRRQTRHLPVIVVTGEIDEILETQLLEEGADDYIRKPLDPRLFLARVEATIRRTLE